MGENKMELSIILEILKQIISLAGFVLASGVITSLLTESLKYIPRIRLFLNHPRITAAVISVVLSTVAIFSLGIISVTDWVSLVIVAGATFYSAIRSYDLVLKELIEKYGKKNI